MKSPSVLCQGMGLGAAVFTAVALWSMPAMAQDASACITVEKAKKETTGDIAMSIYNACKQDVFIRWCHEGPGKGACGAEKFFARNRAIDPEQRIFRKDTIPMGQKIHVAACLGRSARTMKLIDDPKRYKCTPVVRCSSSDERPFSWKKIAGNDDVSVLQVEYKDIKLTTKVSNTDMKLIQTGKASALLKSKICLPTDEARLGAVLRTRVIQEIQNLIDYWRALCFSGDRKPESCEEVFHPKAPRSGGSGVQG